MSRVKATVNFIHAWQHPDEIADEVEAELRFHVQMRTHANIEEGMTPDEAKLAARQSFGNFDQVKVSCCEIKRGFRFDLKRGIKRQWSTLQHPGTSIGGSDEPSGSADQ